MKKSKRLPLTTSHTSRPTTLHVITTITEATLTKLNTSLEITEITLTTIINEETTTEAIIQTTTEVARTTFKATGNIEIKTTFEEINKITIIKEETFIEEEVVEEAYTPIEIKTIMSTDIITSLTINRMIKITRDMTIHVRDHLITLTI